MNLLVAWKKVLLFGLFGAAGCLAGWLVGEPFLLVSDQIAKAAGAGQGQTLISKANAPKAEAPPEFQERLRAAGAKSGDVQISLIWNDTNDLDLHCVDPDGSEIFYRQRHSRSGGELDVDRNAGCRITTSKPVENIYWDRAKPGTYSVYVNFFQQCPAAPTKSPYQVSILNCGERREPIAQTIDKTLGAGEGPKILVAEFEVKPRVQVLVPAEIDVVSGGTREVPVTVRRYGMPADAPVKVTVEGLPGGVTAEPLTLPAPKKTGSKEKESADPNNSGVLVLKGSGSGKTTIKVVAKADAGEGAQDAELEVRGGFSLLMTLAIGFWTALLAVGLCLALVVGQNKYLGKALFAPGRVPLPAVIGGAALAGFASGSLGQILFGVFVAIGASWFGFLIGWVLLGGLLGFGVSFFIPNLDGKKAALAGLGGGFLGALAFLILSFAADFFGRFGGAAVLGFCIGLMVAIVEAAFRSAWLEVYYGEREKITVNLGPEPVKIGGDSRSCTVWARGAADVALKYWIRDGKVHCEDVPSRREAMVCDGDSRPAGGVTVVVRIGNVAAPLGTARPAPPPRPAPPLPPKPPAALPVSADDLPDFPAMPPRSAPPPMPAKPPKPPAPVVAKPAAPPAKPQAAPPKPSTDDYDDGMPMPMSPPPVRASSTKSILDVDDMLAAAASKPAAKPPAPAPAPAARSVAPPAPKPPTPAPPAPKPAPPAAKPPAPARSIAPPAPKPPGDARPVIAAKPGEDSCPTCGRKVSGKPGARYCMVCDKTF